MKTIPLLGGSENAHQVISVQLGAVLLDLTLNYQQSEQWVVDIAVDNIDRVSGTVLEINTDIIDHHDLGIGKLIMIGEDTTLDNLGINNTLVWVDTDEQIQ